MFYYFFCYRTTSDITKQIFLLGGCNDVFDFKNTIIQMYKYIKTQPDYTLIEIIFIGDILIVLNIMNGVPMKKMIKKAVFAIFLLSSAISFPMDKIVFLDSLNAQEKYPSSFFLSTITTAAGIAALTGYAWFSRFQKFNAFEQWLIDTSTKTKRNHSFSNWSVETYASAADLLKHQDLVRQELFYDIQVRGYKFFTDEKGKKIDLVTAEERKKKSKSPLNQEFQKEKQYLESQLEYLANFTSFANLLKKNLPALTSYNREPNNIVLMQCDLTIQQKDPGTLSKLETLIKNVNKWLTKNGNLEKYFIYRTPIFSKNQPLFDDEKEKEIEKVTITLPKLYSNNPLTWKIVNSNKATKLYYQALKRYIRVLTLEQIILQLDK